MQAEVDRRPGVHDDAVEEETGGIPSPDQLRDIAGLFKLLGDPTRARLLYGVLAAGEISVGELAAGSDVPETTVSHALRILRLAGVVSGRRAGRNIIYRVSDDHVRNVLEFSRGHVEHETRTASVAHEWGIS